MVDKARAGNGIGDAVAEVRQALRRVEAKCIIHLFGEMHARLRAEGLDEVYESAAMALCNPHRDPEDEAQRAEARELLAEVGVRGADDLSALLDLARLPWRSVMSRVDTAVARLARTALDAGLSETDVACTDEMAAMLRHRLHAMPSPETWLPVARRIEALAVKLLRRAPHAPSPAAAQARRTGKEGRAREYMFESGRAGLARPAQTSVAKAVGVSDRALRDYGWNSLLEEYQRGLAYYERRSDLRAKKARERSR